MSYNLFLDDLRQPSEAYLMDERTTLFEKTHSLDWEIVRTYEQFVSMIEMRGIPQRVSFDHDLHVEHIRHYFEHTITTGYIEYGNFRQKTGKHCADYLVSKLHKLKEPLPQCFVHSANEVGRKEIRKALQKHTL